MQSIDQSDAVHPSIHPTNQPTSMRPSVGCCSASCVCARARARVCVDGRCAGWVSDDGETLTSLACKIARRALLTWRAHAHTPRSKPIWSHHHNQARYSFLHHAEPHHNKRTGISRARERGDLAAAGPPEPRTKDDDTDSWRAAAVVLARVALFGISTIEVEG